LTYSQRSSVLALLFKKGDPLLLDNFRPISLLNVDLKILSHVLDQRLKKILSKLINEDQTGYIKNRFIGFNLRQIQDIIDYADIITFIIGFNKKIFKLIPKGSVKFNRKSI
jgi:hypothetical protein